MTYMIAAAGTGGHVFPGLAVAEALLEQGVPRSEVIFVGGDRLEARVYPAEGFQLLQVTVAGLRRSMTPDNLKLPAVVMRARGRIAEEIDGAGVRALLGMGGYVTIPAALACRRTKTPFFNAEQNAEAGLANRLTARWAETTFISFPETVGLPDGKWVGNPVRQPFWSFDRGALRPEALARYDLRPGIPVVGVLGGSLGSGVINNAMTAVLGAWSGPPVQVVHLTGPDHLEGLLLRDPGPGVTWRRISFEENMEHFYAVCDLVVSRSGGAVAELTATGTPSILVPGVFGSGGHQEANARYLAGRGAAIVLSERDLSLLGGTVIGLVTEEKRRREMAARAGEIARPEAALTIATTMIEAAR